MFRKILIANRGEIACRIASTAHKLGVHTVGVFSEADKNSRHTQMMKEAYLIGPPPPSQSYLKVDHILDVARRTGAQAVHPGYGFLSENADFVNRLEQEGIEFIGPPASAIRAMGSKSESKHIMDNAQVPIVKGFHGDEQAPEFLLEEAKKIGFPVMLKASLGGGGKGMRIVMEEKEFFDQLEAAKREGMKSFGDDHMLVEKYIQRPRHIEVQVFGDKHGNYVHLNERDCSVQRRHQKVIEEAPSAINSKLRAEIGQAAVKAAQAVGYYNAGTVEFIFDTQTDGFYFMEMNTRLQVEHPVTELVTGLDLVEWQLKVACGMELPIKKQKDIGLYGHSMEARIYSEDPENNFLPGSGKIQVLREPSQVEDIVRIDTGVREGDTITTFYDPMISKLIVHADSREEAIQELYNALNDYKVVGLPTNIKFLKRVLLNNDFKNWDFDTSFIANNEEELLGTAESAADLPVLLSKAHVAIATIWLEHQQDLQANADAASPWNSLDNFRLNASSLRRVSVADQREGGSTDEILIQYNSDNSFSAYSRESPTDATAEAIIEGVEIQINPEDDSELIFKCHDRQFKMGYLVKAESEPSFDGTFKSKVVLLDREGQQLSLQVQPEESIGQGGSSQDSLAKSDFVKSPMPGTVAKVFVSDGQEIKEGESLISVESMKMEYLIRATHDVKIQEVRVAEGQFVQIGERLIIFEKEEELAES